LTIYPTFSALAISCVIVLVPIAGATTLQNQGRLELVQVSDALRDLSESISPSVVQIIRTGYGLTDSEHEDALRVFGRERSTGSGVIVSNDGFIITNAHVVEGSRSIRVKLNGKSGRSTLLDAKIVGSDRSLDLALLKIEAAGLKPLPFGNTVDVKQGQLVLAVGSPLGMENSVSLGVVSSNSRQLNPDDPRMFIQTDAPINPGNSGGPLVDLQGRLVGINTFILSQSGAGEGVGLAIPSDVVQYVYKSIRKDGRVHRGQIGVFARTITIPFALAFKLEPESGVLVEDVIPDGPADNAGVHIGDVIVSVEGVLLHNVRDLALQMYKYAIGDKVDLRILRQRKQLMIGVRVTETKDILTRFAEMVNPDRDLVSKLQILAINVDDEMREALFLREPKGVLVAASVGPMPYFGDQLREGDVIHAVNGQRISTVDMLRNELDKVEKSQPLILQAERDGLFRFIALEPY
jgi:serine protease Do